MTAALGNTGPGTPFATGVDAFVYPQFIGYAQRAPTTKDIYNPGTRWQDNSVNPAIIYETTGAGVWNTAGGNLATTTTPGEVFLATTAQTASGGAPNADFVSSANDVAAALSAIVVGAGVPATIAQQGFVFLATNAQAAAGTVTTNSAIIPSSLAFALANSASLPIGSSTAGTGAFTTLAASSNATVGGTLGVTGASTLAALSATTGTFSSTLGVTGATTLSSTLGVSGASTLAALSATSGTFSTTLGVTGNATFGGTVGITGTLTTTAINATNLTLSGTLGVVGASSFSSGTFSTTLGVSGLSTLAAVTALGAVSINNSGAGNTIVGTGGTGTLALGNATGNTTLTGGLTTLTAAGIITLGTAAQTGTITIGSSTAANSVLIQNGVAASAQTTSINNGASSTGASTVNILNGATPGASQTLAVMAGVASAGTQSIQFLGGANTTGNQNFQVFNGVIAGGGGTVSIFNGAIASGTETFNLFNGNATGGTLVANIFGAVAATTAGTINLGTGAAAHVLNLGSSTAGIMTLSSGTSITLNYQSTPTVQVISTGGKYKGNGANTAPAAGFIGEQIRSAIGSGAAVSLTTATPANVTSVSLTTGIWDVSGLIQYTAPTTFTAGQHCSISTTTATLGTTGDNDILVQWLTANGLQGDCGVSLPSYRLSLSGTTTVYLVAQTAFTGSCTAYGRISATRVA